MFMITFRIAWKLGCAVTFNAREPVEAGKSLSSVGKDSH